MGMDLIEYDCRIEDEFDIRIPDDDAADLLTVGQMHDYLVRRLPASDPKEIWERQLDVLCRFQQRSIAERVVIKPSDHFVRHLNFD